MSLSKKLKGREMDAIIEGVLLQFENAGKRESAGAAMEAAFQADPDEFSATYGLTQNEVARLRRWLAKDPCNYHRPPACRPYYRLCARCRKAENDSRAYHDEVRRLTAGLEGSSLGGFAEDGRILDKGDVVLTHGASSLTAHRSAITGNRAFIQVYDASDTTYVSLYADAETIAATEQCQREFAERMRAERNRPIDPAA
jgi:hypothetical protein